RHMSKILAFTRFSLRDLFATATPTVIVIAAVLIAAYLIIDPAPPRQVSLGTGQENSAYENIGKKYQAAMSKHGIAVTLQNSHGSSENLKRLNEGKVDIAFVQSGSTNEAEAERRGLVSLGSLFTEPIWLFTREQKTPVTSLTQLKGLKINVGAKGS